MNIVLLGAGNIAHYFAQQLSAASGINVIQLYNRTADHGKPLSNAWNIPLVTEIAGIDRNADAFIFCVKDSAIAELAATLPLGERLAVHCAGSQSLDILEACSRNTAVIWPVYSINKNSLPQHREVPLMVEGNNERALQHALYLAEQLSNLVTPVSYQQRQYMHLNAVIANNFTNHLYAICAKISAEQHLPFDSLLPIIRQTVAQLGQYDPASVQTGPAIRNDQPTLQKHLALLGEHPEWAAVYESISASILKMYS